MLVRYSGTEMLARVMVEGDDSVAIAAHRPRNRRGYPAPYWRRLLMVATPRQHDHVATVRQAAPHGLSRSGRGAPVFAACAGASAITVHLREDRRHIQDYDLMGLRNAVRIHLNQELAPIDEMVELAVRIHPDEVCMVPERRAELTTEGGLDVAGLPIG